MLKLTILEKTTKKVKKQQDATTSKIIEVHGIDNDLQMHQLKFFFLIPTDVTEAYNKHTISLILKEYPKLYMIVSV